MAPRPFTRRDLWEVVEVNGVPQPAAYREPLAGPNCSYEVFSLEINFPMPQHADYRGDYGAGRRFIATYEGTRSRPSGARRHWKIGVGRRFLIVVGATVSLAPACATRRDPPAHTRYNNKFRFLCLSLLIDNNLSFAFPL